MDMPITLHILNANLYSFITPQPIRPKGIAIISVSPSVSPSVRPHLSNLNIMKHASHGATAATRHILKGWIFRGIIDPEGIFQIGSFLGKNSFVVGDFEEGIGLEPSNFVGSSHIFRATEY